MKLDRRIISNILYIILGAILFVLCFAGILDDFWRGMSVALISIGISRTVHIVRYSKDEDYRENKQIEATDERNQFLRDKAWACAVYFFILITAVATIVLKLLGQDLLSIVAGSAICILFLLYWICYLVLSKKY